MATRVAPYVHGDLPYPSYTAANAAYKADRERVGAEYVAAAQAWVGGVLAELGDTTLGKVAALHLPDPTHDPGYSPEDYLDCYPCGDCCNGPDRFPCDTVEVILNALPVELQTPPARPGHLYFKAHYWPDPLVTVAFAHHYAARGESGQITTYLPGSEITLPHSQAKRLTNLLLTSSADFVRTLS